MKHYKTIDLCAGIGGIRKGFELTDRFSNVLSAEIDDSACRTYEHLFGENPKNDLTSEEFKNKVCNTRYDVLLAGFPCQTFSRAGKQEGFRDTTKGTIFFDIADIIYRSKPKIVFLENVENLVSHDHGETLKTIITTLESELNYKVVGVQHNDDGSYSYSRKTFVRNSKNYGLPQNRPRTYIMAFSRDCYGDRVDSIKEELPFRSSFAPIAKDLNDILECDVDDVYYMSSRYLNTLKKHKSRQKEKGHGFGYIVVNAEGIKHPKANTILATGGSGKERNLIYQPKEGVSGKVLSGKRSPLNSEGIRVMTPTEWGRLQGFIGYAFMDNEGHDCFSFPENVSRTQQYKQFGNSVTIPVIKEMAMFMLKCLDSIETPEAEVVLKMAREKGYITKQDIVNELSISNYNASSLLKRLCNEEQIELACSGKYSKYRIKTE